MRRPIPAIACTAATAKLLDCDAALSYDWFMAVERSPKSDGDTLPGVYIGLQSRGVFALPADMRKRHHLDEPGAQLLVIERDDGVLELHPQAAVPAGQRWFWGEKWQAMEAEVDAHVAAGEADLHASADALFEHLAAIRQEP
jgi:hypothetical protein